MRLAAIVFLAGLAPAEALGQEIVLKPRVQWEARADAVFGDATAAHLGIGANAAAGSYVRVGAAVAAGPAQRGGRAVASARTDFVARYLLDPFHEVRWGAYAGAGFSAAWDDTAHWRGYLLALLGIEGPAHGGWRTALEIGLGGGVRAGLALRRARTNGR